MSTQINILSANPYTITGGLFAQTANSTPITNINNTTFNTTISNTLDITVQWGAANVGNSIYSDICILNKTY